VPDAEVDVTNLERHALTWFIGEPADDTAVFQARLLVARSWHENPEDNLLTVVGIVLLVFVGYYVSLILHPMAKCMRCRGKPRSKGAIFSYAHRTCSRCAGTGQEPRLGRKLFHMDRDKSK
jgi:hypothetical protein